MKPELSLAQWRRAEAIFEAALECSEEEREAFLQRSCAADRQLRSAVEQLLQRDPGPPPPPLAPSPPEAAATATAPTPATAVRCGPFRLLRPIGEGGTSTVYVGKRAEADLEQRVAIKLMEPVPGAPSQRLLDREVAILSRLEHPNVARFLDAGVASDGRPFVVMEYVEGEPISAYCDRLRLSVRDRVRLFLEVCSAVGYAHQNLIVHRDIKPQNILVSDDGRPKLLDFGIAKALAPGSELVPGLGGDPTVTRERFLTPGYASPEQLAGRPVTTASDVFSLGVLLFRLLTGLLPFGPERGAPAHRERPPASAGRLLDASRSEEPRARLDDLAAARRTSLTALQRQLRGDLETILGVCLRTEPADRYPSVDHLAEDLERYLNRRPIRARPPSVGYRLSKFIRRHRAASAFAGFAGLCLLGLLLSLHLRAVALEAEKDRALEARKESEQVSRFLTEIFRWSDPYLSAESGSAPPGRDVRALLDYSRERLARQMGEQPRLRARLRMRLAEVYLNQGHADEGIALLRLAVETWRGLPEQDAAELAEGLALLAAALVKAREMEEAAPLISEAVELARGAGAQTVALALGLSARAEAEMVKGDYAAAAAAYREAWQIRRALVGESRESARALLGLGWALWMQRDLAAAEDVLVESLEQLRRVSGRRHPDVAAAEYYLGWVRFRSGQLESAESLFRSSLEIRRETQGEEHPETLTSLAELGAFLRLKGDFQGAEEALREAVRLDRKIHGPAHSDLALDLGRLARTTWESGDLGETEALFLEAIRIARTAWGEEYRGTLVLESAIGHLWLDMGRLEVAEAHLRKILALQEEIVGAVHRNSCETRLLLASVRLEQGAAQEAEALARQSLSDLREIEPEDSWRIGLARVVLGRTLARSGRLEEAEGLLLDGYERLTRTFSSASRRSREARRDLAELYGAWERPDLQRKYQATR